jgi:S1-C subfamily serine protease
MLVGLYYLQGRGTQVDTELAYGWLKRAQVNGETRAIAQVMALEKSMQLGRKVEAMTSAMAEVLPDPIPLTRTELDFPANQLLGHGAAFWINQGGYLLTNHHVIERCTELRISGVGIATVVASEPQNDIAVLKLDHQPTSWAALVADQDVQIGMAVTAFTLQHPDSEFENTQAYSGTIKALARPDLDPRYFRFDARLERGSSGAPVINEQGSLVGMVVAKLAAAAAYELTGTATEPVSFALHPVLIREFLDIYAIKYGESGSQEMSQGQIVERLECWY